MTPDRVTLDQVFAKAESIVGRRVADEYLLVPILSRGADADALFTLNRVAAFIWERLDGRVSGEAVVRDVVERFDVSPERAGSDYMGLLEALLTIRAVEPVTPGRHGAC